MKTPEETAAEYLAKYERGAEPPRDQLPAAIRTAWRAYTDPETPEELREVLRVGLDYMTERLAEEGTP